MAQIRHSIDPEPFRAELKSAASFSSSINGKPAYRGERNDLLRSVARDLIAMFAPPENWDR